MDVQGGGLTVKGGTTVFSGGATVVSGAKIELGQVKMNQGTLLAEKGAQLNGGLKMGKIGGSEKAQNALKGSPDVVVSNGGGSSN